MYDNIRNLKNLWDLLSVSGHFLLSHSTEVTRLQSVSWLGYELDIREDVVRLPADVRNLFLPHCSKISCGGPMQPSTWSDNEVRELIAVKVPHTSLLNTTVVAFKVLPFGSYAPMPAPSPPFKTILELVLWNGLQSSRCITPDVINVIKMPLFQYFFTFGNREKSLGARSCVQAGCSNTVICLVAKNFVALIQTPTFSRRHTKTHADSNRCHSERDCCRSTTAQPWNADMPTS